jgi:hypothetical protein
MSGPATFSSAVQCAVLASLMLSSATFDHLDAGPKVFNLCSVESFLTVKPH